jgi:hypothetical protein
MWPELANSCMRNEKTATLTGSGFQSLEKRET